MAYTFTVLYDIHDIFIYIYICLSYIRNVEKKGFTHAYIGDLVCVNESTLHTLQASWTPEHGCVAMKKHNRSRKEPSRTLSIQQESERHPIKDNGATGLKEVLPRDLDLRSPFRFKTSMI